MQAQRDRMAGSVGLVPTMGYLHEGHLSLFRRALEDNDDIIVSIFVNPTQFGPNEDLTRYPRDLNRDLSLIESVSELSTQHSALVFIPTVEEIYPPDFDDWVEVTGPLTERLEGTHRPGHFRGVTTVVARLFRIIRPRRAYFGQKDAQQLRVIRRMVEDQHVDVEIVPMPIVREPDGLAMSSRNVYLSPDEREAALALPRALTLARHLVMDEGITDAEIVRAAVTELVGAGAETALLPARPEALVEPALSEGKGRAEPPRLALDYVSVSDEQTLEELDSIDRPALILLAARAGATRLIDNTIVVPKGVSVPADLRLLIDSDADALPEIRGSDR